MAMISNKQGFQAPLMMNTSNMAPSIGHGFQQYIHRDTAHHPSHFSGPQVSRHRWNPRSGESKRNILEAALEGRHLYDIGTSEYVSKRCTPTISHHTKRPQARTPEFPNTPSRPISDPCLPADDFDDLVELSESYCASFVSRDLSVGGISNVSPLSPVDVGGAAVHAEKQENSFSDGMGCGGGEELMEFSSTLSDIIKLYTDDQDDCLADIDKHVEDACALAVSNDMIASATNSTGTDSIKTSNSGSANELNDLIEDLKKDPAFNETPCANPSANEKEMDSEVQILSDTSVESSKMNKYGGSCGSVESKTCDKSSVQNNSFVNSNEAEAIFDQGVVVEEVEDVEEVNWLQALADQ